MLISVGWREGGLEKMQIEMGGGRIVRMFFSPVQTSSKVRLKLSFIVLLKGRDVEQKQLYFNIDWHTAFKKRNDLNLKEHSALEFGGYYYIIAVFFSLIVIFFRSKVLFVLHSGGFFCFPLIRTVCLINNGRETTALAPTAARESRAALVQTGFSLCCVHAQCRCLEKRHF